MSFLEISGLTKSYGHHQVVKRFDLSVEKGEFISLLGPSGCGKTTVLRMIAGFETPSGGSIRVDGRDVVPLPPNQRNIGMVFQAYALFPNMTVAQNIAFGMKIAKRPSAEIADRVKQMLDMIKLPQIADRYPFQLSGGQQQRVALARAIALKPKILLLDEPLSALDAKIRISLREEIRALQQNLGITTLFVTHDQEEALSMSDRVVVMSEGHMEQVGTPFEIYNWPSTKFVASFVGTLNLLKGKVVEPESGRIIIDGREIVVKNLHAHKVGEDATVALRPEVIRLGELNGHAQTHVNSLPAVVEGVAFQGAIMRIRVNCAGSSIVLDSLSSPATPPPERGTATVISFPADVPVMPEA